MLMDSKGVNGIAGGMNNNFDARFMTPQAPAEQAPQMPMGQMSPEQMQSMMRMMQAQLDQMRANNPEQNTATPESFAAQNEAMPKPGESMNLPMVEQAPMMAEQEKNNEAQPAPAPVEKHDDNEESPVIAELAQETANIPMQRDADNLAFISKVMGKVNWKNPHEAVNVMNWSKWRYLEGTFARKKGDGYGSGRAA